MEAEQKLKSLLTTDVSNDAQSFREWFLEQFNNISKANDCRLEDFAVYFLNSVRQKTEIHLRSSEPDTPKCQTPLHSVKTNINDKLEQKHILLEQHQTDKTTKTVSTHLDLQKQNASECSLEISNYLSEDSVQLQEQNNSSLSILTPHQMSYNTPPFENRAHSFNQSIQSNTSTPLRRISLNSHGQSRRSSNSFTANCAISTPKSSEKVIRTSGAASSLCLGDFLVMNPSSRSNKKKNMHQNQQAENQSKPKKRVVPTTISSRSVNSTPFGNNSSFSNENNILKLSNTEIDDKNKCSILEARKSLKFNASEITKELETASGDIGATSQFIENKLIDVAATASESTTQLDNIELLSPIDLQKVSHTTVIERIANIYSTLIDLNFTTNVLNEIAFLINILNANEDTKSKQISDVTESLQTLALDSTKDDNPTNLNIRNLDLLQNVTNCVFFALSVLKLQRNVLAMLDLKSLGVVLHSERILTLSTDLKTFLESVYLQKQIEIQKCNHADSSAIRVDKSFNNVYYQADKDSRQNFSSNNEFRAFKSQRDLFYNLLKHWESNHLNPSWDFNYEITPKINKIFELSEHPINMAHFSNLFVSQLLISSSYVTSPEEIGVDIDLQKFSKLTQRLVTPSNFSVEYQFPGKQSFFRDFIRSSRSVAFLEQLKLSMYSQLISLNDSTFEVINTLGVEEEDDDDINCVHEFMVRPEVMFSILVLAKFLGFITVLPFNYNDGSLQATIFDKKQLELRNRFEPSFNIDHLLKEAIKTRKLLITLPWIVQYLAMLDNVTLQLDSSLNVVNLLFCIYMHMDVKIVPLTSTAIFIIRCCLGWLFDTKPIISEQYYAYRISYDQNNSNEFQLMTVWNRYRSLKSNESDQLIVNPIHETILNVACPFLAEFRVSIMPAKYSKAKYVSRSGRYRHITTRVSELNSASADNDKNDSIINQKNDQKKLIEAFLHSQNTTMRYLIEFITERIYKSTVKDAHYKVLVPSKKAADKKVNEITSNTYNEVYTLLHSIYDTARSHAIKEWDETVSNIMNERISLSLDALLPTNTTPIVKKTIFHLIRRNITQKISQWRCWNMFKTNFYCSDFKDLAHKICKSNSTNQQPVSSSELLILTATPCVSDLLDDLQYFLHCTSMRPELISEDSEIMKLVSTIPLAFKNVLPAGLYRVIGFGLIQLLQNIITNHPHLLTCALLDAMKDVWLCKEMQSVIKVDRNSSNEKTIPNIFNSLVTIQFIESLGNNQTCHEKLRYVLIDLIENNMITVDFVNDLFIPIFKYDWDPTVLNSISNTLDIIAKKTAPSHNYSGNSSYDDEKSNLFMEVLSELSRDVDTF